MFSWLHTRSMKPTCPDGPYSSARFSPVAAGMLSVLILTVSPALGVDCPPDSPEAPTTFPGTDPKSRFISFVVPSSIAGSQTAIRLKLVKMYNTDSQDPNNQACPERTTQPDLSEFDGQYRWLAEPADFPDETPSTPYPQIHGSAVQCAPDFLDWGDEYGDEMIHVYGAEIVPCSEYVLELVDESCPDLEDPSCYSSPLTLHTGKWGDVVSPFGVTGQPNNADIGAVVDKYKSKLPPSKVNAMLRQNVPPVSTKVDFIDIGLAVDAYQVEAYPFDGPSDCTPDECAGAVTPEPGFARPQEAAVKVSTYSWVNTRHRNVITAIPIIGWSGLGPDMDMAIYHNSALVDATPPGCASIHAGTGVDLGPGWTMAYGDQICLDDAYDPTTITVMHEDGSWDVFTWDSQSETWQAPPGVHDKLEQQYSGESPLDKWRLIHKDQSYHEFETCATTLGRLYRVADPTGVQLQVQYSASCSGSWKITTIQDAAGRDLDFTYDATYGTLDMIQDPAETGETTISLREWEFYFTDSRLYTIEDAMGYLIDIDYDEDGRITEITDKEGSNPYVYDYDESGLVETVTDPDSMDPNDGLVQAFTTTCSNGAWVTTYTDRRSNGWEYHYNSAASGVTSPAGSLIRFKRPDTALMSYFAYDDDYNLLRASDELGRNWVATYDGRGNMLTRSVDPCGLDLTQTWTYNDENNVTGYTDGADNEVTFNYDDTNHPTLLTSIIEPAVGDCQQDPLACPATTTLTYYSNGQLEQVTDPNGVVTKFDYDQWGQLSYYQEGQTTNCAVYVKVLSTDSGSRTYEWFAGRNCSGAALSETGAGGQGSFDNANNPTGGSCLQAAAAAGGGAASQFVADGFPVLPCDAPSLRQTCGLFTGATYSPMGYLENLPLLMDEDGACQGELSREFTLQYDNLRRITASDIESDESGFTVLRGFGYAYNTAGGSVTRTGPDGVETLVQLDDANRVESMRRGPSGDPVMTADYTYYGNGLIESVTYGNGAGTVYEYDGANRLTVIEHDDGSGVLLRLAYTYTANSLPDTSTETDDVSTFAVVDYDYDARGRLVHEDRDDGENSRDYDLTYTYDQGGNRLKKIDAVNDVEVRYHYDLEDPDRYVSRNNRLVYFETLDAEPDPPVVASTTWYYYSILGNPTWIVTKQSGSDDYTATRFGYARNGETVTVVLGETWTWDGQSGCETSQTYDITFAREFRYDSGRARYLDRQLDTDDLPAGIYTPTTTTWSDYDGDEIYGVYTVSPTGSVTNVRSFHPGHGTIDPWTDEGDGATSYFHSDHLGTLREATGAAGNSLRVFTAFGEPVTTQGDGYGYIGAWGYQAQAEFPYHHVGARSYDAGSGRFLQRDPIGFGAGPNVYVYLGGSPSVAVDPTGTISMGNDLNWPARPMPRPKPSPKPAPIPPPSTVGGPTLGQAVTGAGVIIVVGGTVGGGFATGAGAWGGTAGAGTLVWGRNAAGDFFTFCFYYAINVF